MEKAIEWLREKGLAAAAKKAGRIAAEGLVASYVSDDASVGVIVEVNCETDFVANTDNFKAFCAKVAKHIALAKPADVDELLAQKYVDDESKTITDLVSDATVAIGEKISIRRFARYRDQRTALWKATSTWAARSAFWWRPRTTIPLPSPRPLSRRSTMTWPCRSPLPRPSYVRKDEVPSENLNKEKEILRAQALNEGKPEKIVDKMVEGRIEKYYKEVCLLEQPFVKDSDKSIKQV